ncbi:MAG: hypothetical protein D6758_06630, partial [Gammaproteobacteria bacterium]
DRELEFDAETEIRIDDDLAAEQDIEKDETLEFEVEDDVNSTFTAGTLDKVTIVHQVKGPVSQAFSATTPLQVLGQTIEVTGDTFIEDSNNSTLTPSDLSVGDIVEVSGVRDTNGIIRATRLEEKGPGDVTVWQLIGKVGTVNGTTSFTIGNQAIQFNGTTPRDCGTALTVGQTVKVKASAVSGYSGGDPITSTTDIECVNTGLDPSVIPDGQTTLKATMEGVIENLNETAKTFVLNGQTIDYSGVTEYRNGSALDLLNGAKVEAEGRLRKSTGVLEATKIKFRDTRFRAEWPVQASDLTPGISEFTVNGLTFRKTSFTDDDDNLFVTGLSTNRQIEIRGFTDASGTTVYIEEIKDDGNYDVSDVRIRASVDSTPTSTTSFTLRRLTVDTTNATFKLEDDTLTDATTFYSRLKAGVQVDVNHTTLSGTTLSGTMEVELED